MVQGEKMAFIIDQGIADFQRGPADIARTMHPVGVFLIGGRSTDVHVNVGAV